MSTPQAAAPRSKPDSPSATEQFISHWTACSCKGTWQHLTLSKYKGELPDLQQLLVRPLTLRGERMLSLVWRHSTRDITKNLPLDEGVQHIIELLRSDFQHAHLYASDAVHQLSISKKGRSHLVSRPRPTDALQAQPALTQDTPNSPEPSNTHDRAKTRYVDLSRPWLIPAMARKWKQINKFVEVFSNAFADSGLARQQTVKVVDFGCGKGYLTFALHDYLRAQQALQAEVTGVELREDLVHLCNTAAHAAQLQGLHFSHGDVRSQPLQAVDVMIALHACDIATDYAIHSGIRAGASIIMCSPCCHKQIRPQLLSPHPLRPILQHGIHLGQEAEMLTDGLRALLLEASGYTTQVFEFIALEHTSKNKMILGVKRQSPSSVSPAEVWRQIEEIKAFYGIKEQCLEMLLRQDIHPQQV